MSKAPYLLYVVLLALTTQITTAEQLNLAIIYDENQNLLPDNKATYRDEYDLFRTEATPILLPGNLALGLGLLLAPPADEPIEILNDLPKIIAHLNEEFETFLAMHKPDQKRKDTLRDKVAKVKEDLQEDYSTHTDIVLGAENFTKKISGITIGQASWYSKLIKQIDDIDFWLENGFIPDEGLTHFDLSRWHIYLVKNTPQHLILFVPNDYAATHSAIGETGLQLEKLGFNSSELERLAPKDLAARATAYEFDPEQIASSIKRVFVLPKTGSSAPYWNIYIVGHGQPPETGKTPIMSMLKTVDTQKEPDSASSSVPDKEKPAAKGRDDKYVKTSAQIAGMPTHEFLKLMDFWPSLPTNIVVYNTCFGGGTNAESIAQFFNLNVMLAQRAAPDKYFPVVISAAGSEQVTSADYADYKKFFSLLTETFDSPTKTQPEQKKLLVEAVTTITKDTPIILFPRQPKTTAQPAKFSYLVRPDFVLSADKRGKLSASGQKVTRTNVSTTPGEITFNWMSEILEQRLVLQTDTINKKLTFKCTVAPNFDIKVLSDHITFDGIKFTNLALPTFFTESFKKHGKIARISIKSLTGLNSTPPFLTGLTLPIITLSDVELFVWPYYLTPNHGYVVIPYNAQWHVFLLIENDKKINLELLTTIKQPDTEEKQSLEKSNMFKQLETNGKIAYLVVYPHTTKLFAALDGTPSYQQLASNQLYESALTLLLKSDSQLPRLTSIDFLMTPLQNLYDEKLTAVIATLSQKQKVDLMSKLLSDPDAPVYKNTHVIAALLLAGIIPPETVLPEILLAMLNYIIGTDSQHRIIAILNDTLKEKMLIKALLPPNTKYNVAYELVIDNVPLTNAPIDNLTHWLAWLSKPLLAKVVGHLTGEQKKQVLREVTRLELTPEARNFTELLTKT